MKTLQVNALLGLFTLAILLAGCSKDETDTPFYSADNGVSKELTPQEKDGLLYLVEKQKLHRDIYAWMAQEIQSPFYQELSDKDGIQMDILVILVDKYGLENPIVGGNSGEYSDESIQDVYDVFVRSNITEPPLMAQYARQMETVLINNLTQCQSNLCGNADIVKVYDDLMKESVAQLRLLSEEMEGLRHMYAPQASHQEQ